MVHNIDLFELPIELCAKPLALIGLSGLDTLNNAIHKTIWDAFISNRRVERSPVHFKLLNNAHEFPAIKPKRNSYEWYIPKGILKKNWMNKHLNEIPAVIVIFYDLDWNDSFWNEKVIECSSRVQSIRAALEGRTTRITVVLIQQTQPLPTTEDILAADRAAALCANCELNPKSLFVLPLGDHLQGYIVRLETAFYDLAQNYYHHEARNVKSHSEHLNKTTHQYLFVRHQFKIGFLNELKQDNKIAMKHYVHAYNNLIEIRIVDTNALEIKTVASFIVYKLCRLMFALNVPRDAISQFRSFTDKFESVVGFRELTFEHFAWLAKQYAIFGDVFDEAVKLGLPAVQTQHPGFYYQQAAQYAISRKKLCLELCKDVNEYPKPDPLEGIENLEFYGQRPWRPGKLSVEPPDPQKERNAISALQFLEKHVNHSSIIIAYYGLAISQFKNYRGARMRRHLVVQMADEYYCAKDYGKALTLLTHMLWDYRVEKWWHLITDVLQKALNCAFLSANVQDYISLSLELLGELTTKSDNEKLRIFQNLNNVLKNKSPLPEINLSDSETQKALKLWSSLTNPQPSVTIEMNNIHSFVDSKARFSQEKFEADQNIVIEIFIRTSSIEELTFSYLTVNVNTPNFNNEFAVDNASLYFSKKEIKRFLVEFLPDPLDVGHEIQIASISLHLGDKSSRCAILRFLPNGNNQHSEFPQKPKRKNELDFDYIKPLACAQILPRKAKIFVEIDNEQPALVGEWFVITVIITNNEKYAISNVCCKVFGEIYEITQEIATEFSTTSSSSTEKLPLNLHYPNLNPTENAKQSFYIRAHEVSTQTVTLKTSYNLVDSPVSKLENCHEISLEIPIVKPFEITSTFNSNRFEVIDKFYADEVFLFMPHIECTSPIKIIIDKTELVFDKKVKNADHNWKCQLQGVELFENEAGTEMFYLFVEEKSSENISIGVLNVYWKRSGSDLINKTTQVIRGFSVDAIPLRVESNFPAHGFVRTPMAVNFQFHNRSFHLLQFELIMESSEAFMFAGYRQIQLSILPHTVKTLNYNLYPLIAGNVLLPKMTIILNETTINAANFDQNQLNDLLIRCLPTHIYVMPQTKGNPKALVSEMAIG